MEIEVKGNKIELSKSFLTNGEVNYIITEVLKIYNQNDDDIEGLDYSPLAMMTNFYALLFSMCIKDYNLDDIGMYNKYYNMGVQYELLKVITNADEAYHLMMSLSKQMFSVENILDKKSILPKLKLGFIYNATETKTRFTDDDKAEAICLGLAYIKDVRK